MGGHHVGLGHAVTLVEPAGQTTTEEGQRQDNDGDKNGFHAACASRWATASRSRRVEISTFVASSSAPMSCRPSRMAATPVVPEPANGSRTTPPGGQALTRTRISSVVLPVMWCLSVRRIDKH